MPAPTFSLCPTPPSDGQVLIWDPINNEGCPADLCALVSACLTTFTCNAVFFDGSTFLWGFPAMADSSSFSMSVWLYVTGAQIASPRTPQGDMFGAHSAYLFNDPGDSGTENFLGLGGFRSWHGNGGTDIPINDITNITRANPAVITFQNAHGIDAGSYMSTWSAGHFNFTDWGGAFPFVSVAQILSVTSTTITVNQDTSAIASAWVTPSGSNTFGQGGAAFAIINSMELLAGPSVNSSGTLWTWGKALPPGQWVNVLLSVDTNHALNAKVANLYFGETAVPLSAFQDLSGAFDMFFSEANGTEDDSWKICGSYSTGAAVCYMAELWVASGQLVDFTNSANRAKFHNAMNRPVSLGADGSLPTGTPPTLYQRVAGGGVATDFLTNRAGGSPLMLNSGSASFNLAPTSPCSLAPGDSQIVIWDAGMNDWVPANLCALVAACTPTCLPFAVYANRLAVSGYAGNIYTIKRSSDSATQSFGPSGGDAPQAAISAFIGGGAGTVTVWNDQSGNGHDVVEDTGRWDGSPLWLANEINSHPALQIEKFPPGDTTSRGLSTASDVTFPTAAWTVFLVLKHDAYTNDPAYPDVPVHMVPVSINGGPPIDFSISRWLVQMDPNPLISPTGGRMFLEADDAGFNNGNGLQPDTANAADVYDIFEFAWSNNPSDAVAKRNGTDWDTIDPTSNQYATTDFSVTGPLAVGGSFVEAGGTTAPWLGWIAEIWIYNCILTPAERDARRADIAAYYGI